MTDGAVVGPGGSNPALHPEYVLFSDASNIKPDDMTVEQMDVLLRMWGDRFWRVGLNLSDAVVEEQINRLIKVFGYPRSGTGRVVFRSLDHTKVLKVAISEDGMAESKAEAVGRVLDVPIAPARFETVEGVPNVLVMEHVDVIYDIGTAIPESDRGRYSWVLTVDCCQVGWTRAGDLVAYDGGRVGERHRAYQTWPTDR